MSEFKVGDRVLFVKRAGTVQRVTRRSVHVEWPMISGPSGAWPHAPDELVKLPPEPPSLLEAAERLHHQYFDPYWNEPHSAWHDLGAAIEREKAKQ